MEGLLPLVYRAVKKNQTRRQYERLPSGFAASSSSYNSLINMAEIYPQRRESNVYEYQTSNSIQRVTEFYAEKQSHRCRHHRRHKSVGEFDYGFSSPSARPTTGDAPKPLVRFKSHRMFSCITGV